MRFLAGLVSGLLALGVGAASNQPRMNFSGSWDLDKAATRLQLLDVANLERGTLRIEQSDARVHFTRVFAMGGRENSFSLDLPLDGGEVVTEANGETRYSHLTWAEDALVYSVRIVAAGGESTNVVRYRLSADGNTLEAHEQRRGVDNYDNLWVFRRRR